MDQVALERTSSTLAYKGDAPKPEPEVYICTKQDLARRAFALARLVIHLSFHLQGDAQHIPQLRRSVLPHHPIFHVPKDDLYIVPGAERWRMWPMAE